MSFNILEMFQIHHTELLFIFNKCRLSKTFHLPNVYVQQQQKHNDNEWNKTSTTTQLYKPSQEDFVKAKKNEEIKELAVVEAVAQFPSHKKRSQSTIFENSFCEVIIKLEIVRLSFTEVFPESCW